MDVPREYVKLGLRFGLIDTGLVDSYFGDPVLRRDVEAEAAPEPSALARRAVELLDALPGSGLAEDRVDYLTGQLHALRWAGRRLAGGQLSYRDEVEAYLQVRPELADPQEYAEAHRALDGLLPGRGSLVDRYAAYRNADRCPPALLPAVVDAFSRALRDIVRSGLLAPAALAAQCPPSGPSGPSGRDGTDGDCSADPGLPATERVEYQFVTDRPWSGFSQYQGGYHSRVVVNTGLPHRLAHLPGLLAHEAYPGHHTENCRRQLILVDGQGRLEHTIHLVNTPECLVGEGLAELGLHVAVGPGWGRWAANILAGVRSEVAGAAALPWFDGELVEQISTVVGRLDRVRQDAAIMLHDLGADEVEVVAHLSRWLLIPPDRARESLRFIADPLWRAYTTTYVEGPRLLAQWLAAGSDTEPVGQGQRQRFVRLLDEPLTPARLAAQARVPAGAT